MKSAEEIRCIQDASKLIRPQIIVDSIVNEIEDFIKTHSEREYTFKNQTFSSSVKEILESAGFKVKLKHWNTIDSMGCVVPKSIDTVVSW